MKIVIINCFDTIEHRAELLKKTMVTAGHTVSILTSDFRHVHKCRRTQVPEGYRLIHVRPYKKNLSFARLASHSDFAKAVIVVKRIKILDFSNGFCNNAPCTAPLEAV